MRKIFDDNTWRGGNKRVDFDITWSDLNAEEREEYDAFFRPFIEKVISRFPFADDYQDLDWDWSDELMKFYEDPDEALLAAKENFGDCEEFNEK